MVMWLLFPHLRLVALYQKDFVWYLRFISTPLCWSGSFCPHSCLLWLYFSICNTGLEIWYFSPNCWSCRATQNPLKHFDAAASEVHFPWQIKSLQCQAWKKAIPAPMHCWMTCRYVDRLHVESLDEKRALSCTFLGTQQLHQLASINLHYYHESKSLFHESFNKNVFDVVPISLYLSLYI